MPLNFLFSWHGFKRYLGIMVLAGFLMCTAIFLLSFAVFSFLYFGDLQTINLLPILIKSRYPPFIKTEIGLFAISGLCLLALILNHLKPSKHPFGRAHFSKGFETQRAGFFKKEDQSILIGKKYGAPLYANGFEHVLLFAPTGSGKTRSIGIPNLFQYPYSVVCNDIKLTLFQKTSGFREKVLGHRCYCWAPANPLRKTHRFNPLSLISKDKFQRLTDIQRIAHILIPDNKKGDPIWQQTSRKLFKVAVLYLLDNEDKPVTLGEINRLVKQTNFDAWLSQILEETDHYDPEFYRNGFSYLNNHEKTRGSILETFSGYFELFDDPLIDAATSESDFDIQNLRREKITIYVGFSDDDMERLSPLLTLFWQQLISVMIKQVPDLNEEPYPLLCLIDEFSSLRRIERLRRSLKLLREYRVRCVLIMQYIAQTYEQYSHDEAKAFTNIKTKIAFATDDVNDAEYISKLLGTKTIRIVNRSINHQAQGYSESKNYSYQAQPLMRPDEVVRLKPNQSLIIRTGHAPVKALQWIWYREKPMKDLGLDAVFVPEQRLVAYPFVRPVVLEQDDMEI